jgi:dolichyl-phosphate beta-glucosyltransferase
MEESIFLSIVIPAYNSAEILSRKLPVLMDYLDRQQFRYEIIISDDGSNDKGETKEVTGRFQCTYTKLEHNTGKGAAVREGMKIARGKYRIFTDADIPYEPDSILRMLQCMDKGNAQMVIGDRNLIGSSYFREIPLFRRISSAFFTWFVGTIVTTDFFDTQCGIKGFTADTADLIFSLSKIDGFTFDVEIIYIALKRKIPIQKIPVILKNQERSTVKVFKHGIFMFLDLFRIKINFMKGLYNR